MEKEIATGEAASRLPLKKQKRETRKKSLIQNFSKAIPVKEKNRRFPGFLRQPFSLPVVAYGSFKFGEGKSLSFPSIKQKITLKQFFVMKTLFILKKEASHYYEGSILEFVEHNGNKFKLYAQKHSNSDPLGFDDYQCIHILTKNGEFAPIIDSRSLGMSKYDMLSDIIENFKKFIEAVY